MIEGPDTFAGGAFHEQYDRGKSAGRLWVGADGLRFEATANGETGQQRVGKTTAGSVELPFRGLTIKLGGAGDRLVFFTHGDRTGWTIYCADRRILAHPTIAGHPDLLDDLRAVCGVHRRNKLAWVLAGLLIVGAIFGLDQLKDALVPVVARQLPPSVEQQLGDAAFKEVEAEVRFIRDKVLQQQLEALVKPLLDAIPDKRYPFKFHIVRDESLNAFAMPGGNVVLHSGLLLAAEKPEEVLGVLAHEIAHVTEQHSVRMILQSVGLWLILSAVIGDINSIAGTMLDRSSDLLGAKFSRDHERDADAVGWSYLVRARIDPRGMIDFFVRMRSAQLETPGAGVAEGALNFLSTHPTTQERIDRLQARWKALPSAQRVFPTLSLDYRKFKDTLRSKLGRK